jgi:hypothetical protein
MRSGVGALFTIPGALLWLASWIASIVVAFSEGGAWGFVFIFFGVAGPVAGIIEGIAWGNWTALIIGGIGLALIVVGVVVSGDDE